ncbi:hypothetical protein DSW25_15160 [Sulfitobacter donghicola DSW-25 = KCTC 12864 = JCM 14565]|uniref:Uncharacterized protein n=1 Tax=Sulfitobacter donghicola DSW-25 = KCTC 12864 = JCM 14565 TaxID=1300350 RepID=A0A073IE20_9RHOB|nr:hypothetical protein DSW25_15160 [Sulfitobacter donghicola DSW-25 = KCTC 12864 = JCM 14565]
MRGLYLLTKMDTDSLVFGRAFCCGQKDRL